MFAILRQSLMSLVLTYGCNTAKEQPHELTMLTTNVMFSFTVIKQGLLVF